MRSESGGGRRDAAGIAKRSPLGATAGSCGAYLDNPMTEMYSGRGDGGVPGEHWAGSHEAEGDLPRVRKELQ
jgi:hypothetical protein